MQTEIAFNEAVTESLEQIQNFCRRIDAGHKAVEEARIIDAIECLEHSENAIGTVKFSRNGNVTSILSKTIFTLRESVIESLRVQWAREVRVNKDKSELYISDRTGKTHAFVHGFS
jgi:centromere/kinetochore protein ZW10